MTGRFDVRHPRLSSGSRSSLPEQRTAMVAAVNGQRDKLYLLRQQLKLLVGLPASAFVVMWTRRRDPCVPHLG